MKRRWGRSAARKERINLTIHPEILAWARERAGPGRPFASVTHAVEFAIVRLMAEERELRDAIEPRNPRLGALWTQAHDRKLPHGPGGGHP